MYKLFLFYQAGGLLVDTIWPERVAYARAGETLARVSRIALGNISFSRSIHCCPNTLFPLPDQCHRTVNTLYIHPVYI